MINARKEFQEHAAVAPVVCAVVWYSADKEAAVFYLKEGYTSADYEDFLNELDIDYDDGYGQQYVEGTIFYEDGTWSEREDYDGSEWWKHYKRPEVPEFLKA